MKPATQVQPRRFEIFEKLTAAQEARSALRSTKLLCAWMGMDGRL